MFAIGVALRGRLFPFELSDPLVGARGARRFRDRRHLLSSPRRSATAAGDVRAVTYEYGNAFLIVAGLLNLLVVIDAYDVAHGRK